MVRKNTEFYIARPKRALLSSNVASRYAFMPGLKKNISNIRIPGSVYFLSHGERGGRECGVKIVLATFRQQIV